MRQVVGIAGAGRMGQALGRLLVERGEAVAAVASRLQNHAAAAAEFIGGGARGVTYRELAGSAGRILIAVPDSAIGCVAQALAKGGMHAGAVLHTSGALGPEALARLAAAGVACGCLHPLQTVATPAEGVHALPGVCFAVDGDAEAVAWALQIVELLGGHALRIPASARPVYHAAAVMASNAVVSVMAAAVILMKEAGVQEVEALRALGPLAQNSLENALRLGPAAALTGPIQRGDYGTVRSHLDALSKAPGAAADLYRAAGLMALGMARERGLPEAGAAALEELLRKGVRDA